MAKLTAIPLLVIIGWSQSTVPPQCVHRLGKRQCRVLLPARLILEIDIGERLAVVVVHDKAGVQFFTVALTVVKPRGFSHHTQK